MTESENSCRSNAKKSFLAATQFNATTFIDSQKRTELARVISALSWLDSDLTYPDWIKAAIGLKNHYWGSELGYALFDWWSSTGRKYVSEVETRCLWDGIKLNKYPNTIGTLFYLAGESGWNKEVSKEHTDLAAELYGTYPETPQVFTQQIVVAEELPDRQEIPTLAYAPGDPRNPDFEVKVPVVLGSWDDYDEEGNLITHEPSNRDESIDIDDDDDEYIPNFAEVDYAF